MTALTNEVATVTRHNMVISCLHYYLYGYTISNSDFTTSVLLANTISDAVENYFGGSVWGEELFKRSTTLISLDGPRSGVPSCNTMFLL